MALDNCHSSTGRDEHQESGIDGLNRRTYIGLAGSAVVGSVAASGTAGASHCDYETIVLNEGQHVEYGLSDGELYENVLIDQTAPDCSYTIRADNVGGWTVRNVGFYGVGQVGDDAGVFQMTMSVPAGETGTVENVFIDGRGPNLEGSDTEIGGLFAQASHAGHIDIRHTYVAGMGNNAAYQSNPGKDGYSDGSSSHYSCYHRDNTVSQYRIGTPNSTVTNCVGIIHDPDGLRGNYPGTTSQRARCVWGRHHENQVVENSSFYYSPDDAQRDGSQAFQAQHLDDRSNGTKCELVITDCDINDDVPDGELFQEDGNAEVIFNNLGNDPTVGVLQDGGVPTSAEMAACGHREYPDPDVFDSEHGLVGYQNDAVAVHADHYDTEDEAGVAFTVTNDADQELTVTRLRVTPHDASIDELHDEDNGTGRWTSEIHIDADTQDGLCDVGGSAELPRTFDLANDGFDDSADDVARLSAGSAASVALSRFEAAESPVDMVGESVDIEVDYKLEDGTTGSSSFTLDVGSESTVDALLYESDATAIHAAHYDTDDEAGVEFTVSNDSSQQLTVTHVTVTPHGTSINELHDEDSSAGRWVSEVHIDADVQDGICDVAGSTSLPRTFDLANDGFDDSADDVAIMSAGSSSAVALSRFEADEVPVDMAGEQVDIDLDYELDDGSSGTASFTIDVGSGIQYGDDAAAVHADHYDTNDQAGVEFTVSNQSGQEATITHMTVTPSDSSIDELHDEDDGVGRWVSEIHVDAGVQDGVCDVPGSAALPNTFDLATDGWDDDADDVAIMSAGSSASTALSRFEASGTPIDMVGELVDIDVDYELADGATNSASFTLDVA